MVDVTSRSKGKGFQGVIKRYNLERKTRPTELIEP